MVGSLPLRTHPVGVPLPSAAERLVPLPKVEFGQKLLGRGWAWTKLPATNSVAAPSHASLKFIVIFRFNYCFCRQWYRKVDANGDLSR
jgi:hypothetical protein